jgi:hypothetical protein
MPVSVAVLLGDDPDRTEALLDSLRPQLGVRDEVVLVGTDAQLRARRQQGRRLVLAEGTDHWSARAAAVAAATCELVLLVCDDCFVGYRVLDRLSEVLEHNSHLQAAAPRAPHVTGAQNVAIPEAGLHGQREFRTWSREVAREPLSWLPVSRLDATCIMVRRGAAPALQRGVSVRADLAVVCGTAYLHLEEFTCARAIDPSGSLLTLAMIVKDEAAHVASAVRSALPVVDDVLVYDTGSTDGTQQAAEAAGARVVQGYWDDDFAAARNRAIEHVMTPWVMFLDGDEELLLDEPGELRRFLANTDCDLLFLASNSLGNRGGIELECYLGRVHRTDTATWTSPLHEQVVSVVSGRQEDLLYAFYERAWMRHVGYQSDIYAAKGKTERNRDVARSGLERARATGSPRELMTALVNAGRSTRPDQSDVREAVELLEEAWDLRRESTVGLAALAAHTAAKHALELRDDGLFERWVSRYQEISGNDVESRLLTADAAARHGDLREALDILEALPEQFRNVFGRAGKRSSQLRHILTLRLALGLEVGPTIRSIVEHDVPEVELDPMLSADAVDLPALLATHRPPQLLKSLCGQAIRHPQGHRFLRALHTAAPDLLAPVAAAASLPVQQMTVDDAVYWSWALRSVGQADKCPLRRLMRGEDPSRAAIACAVLIESGVEPWAAAELDERLAAVPESDEQAVLAALHIYAPRLADAVTAA